LVDFSVRVVVVSPATLDSQSLHVTDAVVVGSTASLLQSLQVSVLVVAGSTDVWEASQSAQSKLDVEVAVAGSTGTEELVQSAQVDSAVVVEVFAGSTLSDVVELQSSQTDEVEVVVAALTGVSFVVVVVFASTAVHEGSESEVVVFQSTQVSRATFS
jgi:hypothetical protein